MSLYACKQVFCLWGLNYPYKRVWTDASQQMVGYVNILNIIKNFFVKNPSYEPSLNEILASIYILSCRTMYEKPQKSLIGTAYRHQNQHRPTQEQHPRQ